MFSSYYNNIILHIYTILQYDTQTKPFFQHIINKKNKIMRILCYTYMAKYILIGSLKIESIFKILEIIIFTLPKCEYCHIVFM